MTCSKIFIPSCKELAALEPQIEAMAATTDMLVVPVCADLPPAENRNACLDLCADDVCVMVDDDVIGFFDGWAETLIEPLKNDAVKIVFARLMENDGKVQRHAGETAVNTESAASAVEFYPSACMAFKFDKSIRFDENLKYYEDLDFEQQYRDKYDECLFLVNNSVKLTHLREGKQKRYGWLDSRKYLRDKIGQRNHRLLHII